LGQIEKEIINLPDKMHPSIIESDSKGKSLGGEIYNSSNDLKTIGELICWGLGTSTIPEFLYPLMQFYSFQYPHILQYLRFYSIRKGRDQKS
jgi:hypothetical protein